jgi:hypothetical protein
MPLPKASEALESDVLPNEILDTIRFHIAEPALLNTLARSSRKFHSIFQTPRLISRLLFHVTRNNQALVKKLFEISPAHIEYLTARDIIKDDAGRKFRKVSAFEYALWAQNVYMLKLMINSLRKAFDEGYCNAENVRTELMKQYDHVVNKGLNYSFERIKIKDGQPLLSTVEVREETHFKFNNMLCVWDFPADEKVKKGVIYLHPIGRQDAVLQYKLISLCGKLIKDDINLAELLPPPQFMTGSNQIKLRVHSVLKITEERGHTHPYALLSALHSYERQCRRRNEAKDQRDFYWCQVIGKAQLMIPYHIAQWYGELSPTVEARYFVPSGLSQLWWPHPPFINNLGKNFAITSDRASVTPGGQGARAIPSGDNFLARKREYRALNTLFEKNSEIVSNLKDLLITVFTKPERSSESEDPEDDYSFTVA